MHNALYTMFFLIILVLSTSAAAIVLALVARHISRLLAVDDMMNRVIRQQLVLKSL